MKEAGVGWVRMDFLWDDIEPEEGKLTFKIELLDDEGKVVVCPRKEMPAGPNPKELEIEVEAVTAKCHYGYKVGDKITVKRFYERMNHFIKSDDIIIAETGDCIFSAADLYLPEGARFLDQAFYLSIGYSVPATLGAQLAAPKKRVVTFVGDGAFQMTGQELSTIIRNGLRSWD